MQKGNRFRRPLNCLSLVRTGSEDCLNGEFASEDNGYVFISDRAKEIFKYILERLGIIAFAEIS